MPPSLEVHFAYAIARATMTQAVCENDNSLFDHKSNFEGKFCLLFDCYCLLFRANMDEYNYTYFY